MFISKKHLSRRTLLKGAGASLSLPLLSAMAPAFAQSSLVIQPRLGFVYIPHGAIMSEYTPDKVGTGFEFKPILKPLEAYRDRMTIVSGLGHAAADTTAVHSLSPCTWLSGIRPKATLGSDAFAGITADQYAAQVIGQDTPLPSLELATEDHSGLIGACDRDYGCIYMNTLSWRSPTTPNPMEINPRKVFERLFGTGGSMDERLSRQAEDRSILDGVVRQTQAFSGELGNNDREKVTNYLDNIREIERRIQQAERLIIENPDMDIPDAPAGIPFAYEDHLAIMFELMALAYQSDITRVSTFMMARELSNRTYSMVGVNEGHHATSHHGNNADKMAKNVKIQTYHVNQFKKFIDTLDSIEEGDGTLLDNSIILYGSNMSNSNLHDHYPLPNVLLGGTDRIKGGQHISYEQRTPMTNLILTMLNKAGVELEQLGDSTGLVDQV
ncbi:MAG: DUF1552 domain-containing protein [Gammaproteobacteria bacterium]|nr:DUF1552 domain-containing protein [Gammaproteobacteria bacterium]